MPATRRTFLHGTMAAAASLSGRGILRHARGEETAAQQPPLETPDSVRRGEMLYRQLGSTGQEVSLLGLGGFHIGIPKDEQEAIRIVQTAIDRGVTFLDNCWDYHDGESERRMGKALAKGYRDKVFLMTKIDGRTKALAARQIDESLERLKTDRVDLMQLHEVIRLEDPDRAFDDDGAIAALSAAKQAGKIRFIGFTGHKDPVVHLRMLDLAQQHGFVFDAVQMPINVMDAHFRSFSGQVLPRLVERGIGPLGMKPFGGPFVLKQVLKAGTATPIELLHFAMSQPVSVTITGIDSMKVLDQAFDAVATFEPLSRDQRDDLLSRVAEAAADGEHERYKTTADFDATAKNPDWIG